MNDVSKILLATEYFIEDKKCRRCVNQRLGRIYENLQIIMILPSTAGKHRFPNSIYQFWKNIKPVALYDDHIGVESTNQIMNRDGNIMGSSPKSGIQVSVAIGFRNESDVTDG